MRRSMSSRLWLSTIVMFIGSARTLSAQPVITDLQPHGAQKGKPFTSFVGGSDLAVPIGANKALAVDWIQAFTDTASQRALQAKGNIPNASNLLGKTVNERAAVGGWTVPTAKNWVNVENGNILRNMLTQILTGKLTVKQAAASASDNINSVLNAG